jgi:hypothetical protein
MKTEVFVDIEGKVEGAAPLGKCANIAAGGINLD